MKKYPIVLVHGIARFDILRQILIENNVVLDPEEKLHYFKGIKPFLEQHGFRTYYADVTFAGSVNENARRLSVRINEILADGHDKVHIIGHSMGGLNARRMIVDFAGMAQRIASVTTIGTPHKGSPVADAVIGFGGALLREMLSPLIHLEGVGDLTTGACRAFNDRARNAEARNAVAYQVYYAQQELRDVFAPLQPAWLIIHDKAKEGDNDGLVSVTSQKWEATLKADDGTEKRILQKSFPVPADHLNEVGWWDLQESRVSVGMTPLLLQASAYEEKIRSVYLEIATSLPE